MNKLKDHIYMSKQVIKCKNCKTLLIVSYLDQTLCKQCEKIYAELVNQCMQ